MRHFASYHSHSRHSPWALSSCLMRGADALDHAWQASRAAILNAVHALSRALDFLGAWHCHTGWAMGLRALTAAVSRGFGDGNACMTDFGMLTPKGFSPACHATIPMETRRKLHDFSSGLCGGGSHQRPCSRPQIDAESCAGARNEAPDFAVNDAPQPKPSNRRSAHLMHGRQFAATHALHIPGEADRASGCHIMARAFRMPDWSPLACTCTAELRPPVAAALPFKPRECHSCHLRASSPPSANHRGRYLVFVSKSRALLACEGFTGP